MNATIGEIQKATDDEFNDNVRRFMLSKYSEPWMTVKPQKTEDSPNIKEVDWTRKDTIANFPQTNRLKRTIIPA